MRGTRKREQCARLQKRLTAAEGEPCENRVGIEFGDNLADRGHPSAGERLRGRVMTARTAPRTALGKDSQPDAFAVHDGVTCDSGDVNLSGVRA